MRLRTAALTAPRLRVSCQSPGSSPGQSSCISARPSLSPVHREISLVNLQTAWLLPPPQPSGKPLLLAPSHQSQASRRERTTDPDRPSQVMALHSTPAAGRRRTPALQRGLTHSLPRSLGARLPCTWSVSLPSNECRPGHWRWQCWRLAPRPRQLRAELTWPRFRAHGPERAVKALSLN